MRVWDDLHGWQHTARSSWSSSTTSSTPAPNLVAPSSRMRSALMIASASETTPSRYGTTISIVRGRLVRK